MSGSMGRMEYFLSCLFLLAVSLLPAQEVPNLTNFTYKDLKAQNQNWMISQDRSQQMYFANSNGLIEFDGQRWQVFSLPQKQIVRAVGIDANGYIFTGGYGEFGYWHPSETGELEYQSLSQRLEAELISREEIWNVEIGDSWVIFQSFTTLFFYNYQQLQILAPPDGGSISFIHKAQKRYFIFQQSQRLVELLISSQGIEFKEISRHPLLANKNLVGMIATDEKNWLFCTARNGIFIGSGQNLEPWKHEFEGQFAEYELNRVLELSTGEFAFGTILNGVYITDSSGHRRFHLNQSKGLQNNTILSLYQDRRNHLWLGTDNGMDMVDLNPSIRLYKDLSGELGAIYAAAYFKGKLFLGSNHGLFCKNEGSSPPFTLIPGTQGQVWELKNVGNGLIIGHNNGSFLWDGKILSPISEQSGGWCSANFPTQEDLFLQGTYGGIVKFQKNKASQAYEAQRIEGFPTSVKQLYIDEDQWIWAVNPYRGLHKIRLDEKKEVVAEMQRIDTSGSLATDFNLRLMGGKANHVLKAGDGYYLLRRGQVEPIDRLGSLILEEELQHIWVGNEGDTFLIYPDRITLKSTHSRLSFPLRLIPNYEKIELINEGEYLFCLETGYAIFQDQHKWQNLLPPPPLRIKNVVSLTEKTQLIWRANGQKQQSSLNLGPSQKHLRFNFGLPYYEGQVRFRYRLQGFTDPWSEWDSQSFKEYTNLSPGSYQLQVEEDQFGQQVSFEFYLAPPWYQSTFAKIIYALILMALIVAFYYLHKYLLRVQQRRTSIEKEREFQQKIIREKNLQLQRDIQNKSRELANSTMGLIRKNETLMELKQELEDLYKKAGTQLPRGPYQKLKRRIDHSLSDEKDWQVFETNFSQVHQEFFQKLKNNYPDLTAGDLRLAAFLRMGLSSKEIAPLFNISLRGIENKRYRLRKKMTLQKDENLLDVLMSF